MKQHWQNLTAKIDGLSLRERVIIFIMIAVLVLTIFNALLFNPLLAKQKQLSQQTKSEQTQILQIQSQIREVIQGRQDPDAANRARLKELQQQLAPMHASLLEMQKGLVSPDRMTVLLEDILRRDSRLKLLSLKTLPVSSLDDTGSETFRTSAQKVALPSITLAKGTEEKASDSNPVFKHGVEIVVQGTYLDMVQYMDALEGMPWQLFWHKAALDVEKYPVATLTLTLFTLSLDETWLNL